MGGKHTQGTSRGVLALVLSLCTVIPAILPVMGYLDAEDRARRQDARVEQQDANFALAQEVLETIPFHEQMHLVYRIPEEEHVAGYVYRTSDPVGRGRIYLDPRFTRDAPSLVRHEAAHVLQNLTTEAYAEKHGIPYSIAREALHERLDEIYGANNGVEHSADCLAIYLAAQHGEHASTGYTSTCPVGSFAISEALLNLEMPA